MINIGNHRHDSESNLCPQGTLRLTERGGVGITKYFLLLKILQWQPMSYKKKCTTPEYGLQDPLLSRPCNIFAHPSIFQIKRFAYVEFPKVGIWTFPVTHWAPYCLSGFSEPHPLPLMVCPLWPEELLPICLTTSHVTLDAPLYMFPLAPLLLP